MPLTENWRKSGVYAPYSNVPSLIGASGGYAWYFTYSAPKGNTLEVLSTPAGLPQWDRYRLPAYDSFAADQDAIYVAFQGYLEAFSLFTGHTLWRTATLPQHTSNILYVHGDVLEAYSDYQDIITPRQQIIRVFSLRSGDLLSKEVIPSDRGGWLRLRSADLRIWSNGDSIWARSNRSGEVPWSLPLNHCFVFDPTTPVQMGLRILLSHCHPASIYSIDISRGSVIWSTPPRFLSNFALFAGHLFVIDSETDLVAINPIDGSEVGRVTFAHQRRPANHQPGSFAVAADRDLLLVYFGDSQEIIAYSMQKR